MLEPSRSCTVPVATCGKVRRFGRSRVLSAAGKQYSEGWHTSAKPLIRLNCFKSELCSTDHSGLAGYRQAAVSRTAGRPTCRTVGNAAGQREAERFAVEFASTSVGTSRDPEATTRHGRAERRRDRGAARTRGLLSRVGARRRQRSRAAHRRRVYRHGIACCRRVRGTLRDFTVQRFGRCAWRRRRCERHGVTADHRARRAGPAKTAFVFRGVD